MVLSFVIWGCVLKGWFERGIFGRVKLRLKGCPKGIINILYLACA